MSGIGDYIHYKKSNYRKFGTYRNENSNYSEAMDIYQKQRNSLKARIPSTQNKELEELENFLNGMMYGKEKNPQADIKAMKELQDRLLTVFQEKYNNFGINFTKGLGVYYDPKLISNRKEEIDISVLENYLQRIINLANTNNKAKSFDINKINQTIQELENYINTHQNEKKVSLTNATAQNLIANINEVLKMQSVPMALAIGDAFEYWLALASQYAGAKAIEEADKVVNDLVKGTTGRSNPIISLSNFSDEFVSMDDLINSGVFSPNWKPINNSTAFKFDKPTQDKLDVVFEWKGDELNISAKNYKLSSDDKMIHLVSGTSLLYLISTENTDFVNHWLNTVSGNSGDTIAKANLTSAHIAMKLTLFAKALTGMGTSSNSNVADTFILNNRTKSHIYVRNMKNVFNAVDSIIDNDINAVRFKNYPNRIPNVWVGKKQGAMDRASAQQRITNLIARLHTYNISVSMNPNKILK